MTIRILVIAVILCTLFGAGGTSEKPDYDAGAAYLFESPPIVEPTAREKSDYDAGLAAYERGHYQAALYDFETRAMKGDPIAQFCLGFMYKNGEGVRASDEKAEEWYTKAAEQGYVPAQINLAAMYVHRAEAAVGGLLDALEVLEKTRNEIENELEKTRNEIEQKEKLLELDVKAIRSGLDKRNKRLDKKLEESENLVDKKLKESKNLAGSYETAMQWTMESSGSPIALYNLAQLHIAFDAMFNKASELSPQEFKNPKMMIPELYPTVLGLFDVTAAKDYAPAQNELAKIYRDGLWGVTPDPEKALELFEKAAAPNSDTADSYKNGYAPAQFNLAEMYKTEMYKDSASKSKDSQKIKEDAEKALNWYTKAANQGYAPAQYQLGFIYDPFRGAKSILDPDSGLEYTNEVDESLEKALKKTLTEAERSAESMVTKRYTESIKWYTKAAKQDYAPAQSSLSLRYELDNPERALRLAFKAAQQGEAWAQFDLGFKFQMGAGVPQDDAEAYYWYSLVHKHKDKLADPAWTKAQYDEFSTTISKLPDEVKRKLSEDQKEEIQERVKKWKPRILDSVGTGFYIDENHILTNAHVARDKVHYKHNGDERVEWREYDELRVGHRYVEEKSGAEAVNPNVDLALLYDDDPLGNMDTFATFRSNRVEVEEDIVSFGYPKSDVLSYDGNVTRGRVSGRLGPISDPRPDNHFQHTAPIQAGNSGGPIFDLAGNVVGITRHGMRPSQNVNFAIKFKVVKDFLEKNDINPSMDNKEKILGKISEEARKFTFPVLCFINKRAEPLPVVELTIEDIANLERKNK